MSYQEEYEATQRRKALREFKRENREYEKNLYKDDKLAATASNVVNFIIMLLFAFVLVSGCGILFARIASFVSQVPATAIVYELQHK